MPNARFASRNFHDEATLTASTTATGYPITHTTHIARDRVWRSGLIGAASYDEPPDPTPSALQTIEGVWPGEGGRIVNVIALFQHTLHGGSIRVELFDDVSMLSGDRVYDTGTVDVYTVSLLGDFVWGVNLLGADTDWYYRDTPIVFYPDNVPCAAYRITIDESATTSLGGHGNDFYEIGRIWLAEAMELSSNPDYGLSLGYATNGTRSRSRGGSVRGWRGAAWRVMSMNLGQIIEAERPRLLDMMRDCLLTQDMFASIFPEAGGRQERDHTMAGVMASLDPVVWSNYTWRSKRLVLEER